VVLIPVTINITEDYYLNPGHFWRRFRQVSNLYGAEGAREILLRISYEFNKPQVTKEQVTHYRETLRVFPHVCVIHAKGVRWDGHDEELKAMGIPIHDDEGVTH
jgi:hypothetical protein